MAKETVDVLVEGGKATAAPPLGPALGPMGVNIGQVVSDINKKTADFKGMQVPVKVIIDTITKDYEIEVGTPPASSLIKEEAKIKSGSGHPKSQKVADLKIEQIIKIAKMKEGNLLGKDNKNKVLEIVGTCQSMGIMVEGMDAPKAIEAIKKGKFDKEIKSGKTELTQEEIKELEEEKKRFAQEMKEKHDEHVKKAKEIIAQMQGEENRIIRKALHEANIFEEVINELAPEETEVEVNK
jgi:large subunit ribosomal protein L11